MKKENYDYLHGKIVRVVSGNQFMCVCQLKDGRYLKIFQPAIIQIFKGLNSDLESKIKDIDKLNIIPEIITPNSLVYMNNYFIGYTMPAARGISLVDYEHRKTNLEQLDLSRYTKEYSKLESIIKKANQRNIFFPDLLTCDNIFIDNNNYQFIDFDGIQIGDYQVLQMCNLLGDDEQYTIPKYMYKEGLFSANLDKKSLLYYFYLCVFNLNLNKVNNTNPIDGSIITLDYIFDLLGIKNINLMNATNLAINDQENDNIYLDDIVNELAFEYDLKRIDSNKGIKKLVKK